MHGSWTEKLDPRRIRARASNRIPEGALGRTLHCAPAHPSFPEISRPAAIGAADKTKREIVK
jgi:hypothetical protein